MDPSVPLHLSRKETFYLHNSLLCLAKAMENRYTTVDLRNEVSVTGKITEVDGYMNVILSDATLYDTDGDYQYFPMLHIQARNIRNIHVPDNMSIMKTIKSVLIKKEKKSSKKLTFKESRAKKQQKETLKLIEEIKKEKQLVKEKTVKEFHKEEYETY